MNSVTAIAPDAPSFTDTAPDYIRKLNPAQREAVEATDGPVLVLAGAGTGKTRVLTTRIAWLIQSRKAFPGQILSVTFTNKAAREMIERVKHLLIDTVKDEDIADFQPSAATQGMWLGTFHSIGARILRRHAESVGLTSAFTILDTDDQIRVIKSIIEEKNLDEKQNPAKFILATIQRWKDLGLTPEKVTPTHMHGGYDRQSYDIYKDYQRRLQQVNACDFGDLLLHNLTLFQKHPEVLQEYNRRFRYVLVDEYQDTNVAQYLWLRMLTIDHKNICCVGDDDQSIYGWRGAEIDNILRFEKDFPGAHTVRLEQNYRSTPAILAAAAGLISNNADRLGKTLWTDMAESEPIRIKSTWDEQEESRFVGEEVESRQRDRIPLSEMAVLVRAGYQTRSFEERFLTLGLPYRVIGGLRFYERMEIRDAIAYMRLVMQSRDDLAFERIINTPKRGIGKATLEVLHTHARKHNISLLESTRELIEEGKITGKARGQLAMFVEAMTRWAKQAAELPPSTLTEIVLEESGYIAMWQADKSIEAQGRIENLRELLRAMEEFQSLGDFLEHVGLVTDIDNMNSDDMISIMTLHAAKGLEFNTVFLTGWEEGLFPSQRTLDENGNKGLEEERRLAYVGITRAKRRLFISHAANRRIYGQWQSSLPSRFLDELPHDHIEHLDGGPGSGMMRAKGPQLFQREIENIMQVAQRAKPVTVSANAYLGKRVFHMKFGYGIVIAAHGDHLDISFEKSGRKKIMAEFVDVVK